MEAVVFEEMRPHLPLHLCLSMMEEAPEENSLLSCMDDDIIAGAKRGAGRCSIIPDHQTSPPHTTI